MKTVTNLITNIVIIAVIIFTVITYVWIKIGIRKQHNTYNSWETNKLKPIDDFDISTNLPYSKYNSIRDSLITMRNLRNGDALEGSGIRIGYIGITTALSCDTCSIHWFNYHNFRDRTHTQIYLKLSGWKLKNRNDLGYVDEGKFYVNNGQGYVRKTVADASTKRADGSIYNKIHIEDMPVNFRYDHNDDTILIPITSKEAGMYSKILKGIMLVMGIYVLALLFVFLKFIIDLCKGLSFTDKNVIRLRFLAVSLTIYPIILFLFNYSMKIIFHNYFAPEIILNNNIWVDSWRTFEIGILFFLLFNAFRKGKSLQDEQDLII